MWIAQKHLKKEKKKNKHQSADSRSAQIYSRDWAEPILYWN